MIRSSIDIGTNSVLLLVADVSDSELEVLYEEQHVPRLGKNVDKNRTLDPASQQRVVNVLKTFQNKLSEAFPELVDQPIITATSAVRDASNRAEFLDIVNRELGWNIRVLSGDEEAATTYAGAVSVLNLAQISDTVIIDIGGGSTEFAAGSGQKYHKGISLNIGSVRFTERYFSSDPPESNMIEKARTAIRDELRTLDILYYKGELVGVAGTATSLAAIDLGLADYEPKKLNGYRLSMSFISNFIEEISKMESKAIEETYPPFLTGRGEVILAGILILEEFMQLTGRDELVISTGGIRHGMLFK